MTLIKPMKRALEIVRMFNGLERGQLWFFLKKEYHNRDPNLDIDRLLRTKLIYEDDSCIFVPDLSAETQICEAVRVFQVFWTKGVIAYNKGDYPALIVYNKQTENGLRKFYICVDETVSKLRICEENTVVVVITQNKQLQCPHLQNYYLAVKESGKYNFYKEKKYEFQRN
jgi:hypothetical protein